MSVVPPRASNFTTFIKYPLMKNPACDPVKLHLRSLPPAGGGGGEVGLTECPRFKFLKKFRTVYLRAV